MREKKDWTIRQAVGKLIQVLHGEYSDTRDLAVVQLAVLGEKAVPYILSFLKKEADLERDFVEIHKIWCRILKEESKGPSWKVSPASEQRLKELEESKKRFLEYFKKKWGFEICVLGNIYYPAQETSPPDLWQRKEAVDRALEALAIIGDPKVIPALKKLPVYNYTPRPTDWPESPLFEKAKETTDKILSVCAR